MRRVGLSLFAAIAVGALSGCSSDFERIVFLSSVNPPVDVLVTFEEIRIPEGVAVITTARPMSESGVMARDTYIELKSADEGVMGVAWTLPQEIRDQSESESWDFVLFGVSAGSTTITVEVEGSAQAEIPAVVEPQ